MDYIATGLMTGILWMPFFNIGLGINPLLLGIVLMVLRAWDAITDPIMGNISDNTRTHWGRRRPYLFVGAILTALMFPVLWYLPHSIQDGSSWLAGVVEWVPLIAQVDAPIEQKAAALYLMLIGIAFFSCFTLWSMPYYGLQLELTPNYDERTRLTAWMTFFSKISTLMGSWLLALIILVGTVALGEPTDSLKLPAWAQNVISQLQPWLMQITGAEAGEKPIVVGMRVVCWLLAGSILVQVSALNDRVGLSASGYTALRFPLPRL